MADTDENSNSISISDLHTHSDMSDGSMSPEELVYHAEKMGVCAIALTDHDTVSGINEALIAGKSAGVEVLPGVEISTDAYPEIHILGYFNEDNYIGIDEFLMSNRVSRDIRNLEIIEKLKKHGINISIDDIAYQEDGVAGRVHIAKALIERGHAKDIHDAFNRYLSEGAKAYVPRKKLLPEEGIQAILKCGGVPVLAHPVLLGLESAEFEKLLEGLVRAGLKGIEAIYSENKDIETRYYINAADRLSLIATGGSDFHGANKPGIEIGTGRGNLYIGYNIFRALKQAVNSY